MSVIKCCKDCTRRHKKCHSTCEDYQKEKKEYEKEREYRNKKTQESIAMREHQLRLLKRYERKGRKI